MAGLTPMMKQYQKIKDYHKDAILFFRLGDFYEMFFEDAVKASKILNITLTSRDAGNDNRVPMCGVPHHSASSYIAKLIRSGYKVAICEQMEDPKYAKGPVKREVVRIITPGTILDEELLEEKNSNYLLAVYQKGNEYALASVDISTGDFNACRISELQQLADEVTRISPSEILLPQSMEETTKMLFSSNYNVTPLNESYFSDEKEILTNLFNVYSLDALGLKEYPLVQKAAAAIINYMQETLKKNLYHIKHLNLYDPRGYMILDANTRNNLEILGTQKKLSLLKTLDFTVTAMGGRMLKKWLVQPLVEKKFIDERLDAVDELKNNILLREDLRKSLKDCYDLERLLGKVAYGSANARDLIALKNSLEILPKVKKLLHSCVSKLLRELYEKIDEVPDIYELLDRSICEDPPVHLKEGNLIKEGFNEDVDSLRKAKREGKQWIADMEKQEKEKTGIKSLKIGYNKVFGYYIEITRANLHLVPEEYSRKQTLANAERFITPKLKEYENKILGAEEKLSDLEYEIFIKVRDKVAEAISRIQGSAGAVAELDVLLSFAECAHVNNYVKPTITEDDVINIKGGRHPVVEKNIEERFVPNDTFLDNNENNILVITGPNMAGKSTYLRQTALITIMAQAGSFVPAKEASIGVVDRVFTRIGASDNLAEGESTFMVEMNEVANIIKNATFKSLVILDEVGRGTSTYDGLSLAWAITEYIYSKIGCKCLFATHYHELTELEKYFKGIKNYNIAVKEKGEKIIFLREIVRGGADKSYGIHVAKLAGLPEEILVRSQALLKNIGRESGFIKLENNFSSENDALQISFWNSQNLSKKDEAALKVIEELKELDLLNTSPLEAINILYEYQRRLKEEK